MKRLLSFFLIAGLALSLTACGVTTPTGGAPAENDAAAADSADAGGAAAVQTGTGGNTLVAYFSWADNAVLSAEVDAVSSPSVVAPGNVQELAGWVQQQTGGDLFAIRVAEPYSSDWDECLARANEERGADARPALNARVDNLAAYDTVFLGYPNWWYTAPHIIRTFLESYDFSGKTIVLFATSGGSGLGKTAQELQTSAPAAQIKSGKLLQGRLSADALRRWVESIA